MEQQANNNIEYQKRNLPDKQSMKKTPQSAVKKPDEGDLLMGGILDGGDDDLGLNRFNTKSAPPDLYFQQKQMSQIQGKNNFFTKEYKDYFKDQNNPILQKTLSRQGINEQEELQRLQKQLDSLNFNEEPSNFQQVSHQSDISNQRASPAIFAPAVFQSQKQSQHSIISDQIQQTSVKLPVFPELLQGVQSFNGNLQDIQNSQLEVQQNNQLLFQKQLSQQQQIQQAIPQQLSPQFQQQQIAQMGEYSSIQGQYYSYPMMFNPQTPGNFNPPSSFQPYIPVVPYGGNMMYAGPYMGVDYFQTQQQGYQQQYLMQGNQSIESKQQTSNGRVNQNSYPYNSHNTRHNNNNNFPSFGENNGYSQQPSLSNGKNYYQQNQQYHHQQQNSHQNNNRSNNNNNNNNYNLQKKKIINGNHAPYNQTSESQQQSNTNLPSHGQFNIFNDLIELCKDQTSSRTIQKQFENSTVEEKNKIFDQIEPESLNLMRDQFGNYVIQKLFEKGTAQHKERLFNKIKGNVQQLSLHTYGCRVIQKALEELKDKPLMQEELIQELNFQIMECIQDQNGNHVIQKCFETLPSTKLIPIINEVIAHIEDLAFHSYGCRVIQRILEFCQISETTQIYDKLMENLIELCKCQYGNYIIQYVIEKGNKIKKDDILKVVRINFVELSLNNNVTEKSVSFSDDQFKHGVLQVLLQSPPNHPLESGIIRLTKNAFGNYVVQRLYDKASTETKLQMCQYLLQNQDVYQEVCSNGFGKHVLTNIEKNRVDGESSTMITQNGIINNINGSYSMNNGNMINNHNNNGYPFHSNMNDGLNHGNTNSNGYHNNYHNSNNQNVFIKKRNSNGINNNIHNNNNYQPVHQ